MNVSKTPPVLRENPDGSWLIIVIDPDGTEHAAPVGEWFAAQFITRVVLTKLVLDAPKEIEPNAWILFKKNDEIPDGIVDVKWKTGGETIGYAPHRLEWGNVLFWRKNIGGRIA